MWNIYKYTITGLKRSHSEISVINKIEQEDLLLPQGYDFKINKVSLLCNFLYLYRTEEDIDI